MPIQRRALLASSLAVLTGGGALAATPWPDRQARTFPSRIALTQAFVPAETDSLTTRGWAKAGDGGGAFYRRAEVEPSHPGKLESADGAWWEIAETELTPQMFGADGGSDDSAACQACCETALALGATVFVPNLYPHYSLPSGFFELVDPDPGQNLVIRSDGAELRLTSGGADLVDGQRVQRIIRFGSRYNLAQRPGRATRLVVEGLVLDGRGIPEQWAETVFVNLRQARAIETSAEHVDIRNCPIRNIYGNGILCFGSQTAIIDNCPAERVGGRWIDASHDSFGDPYYFSFIQEGGLAGVWNCSARGWPCHRSRAGVVFEYSENRYQGRVIDSVFANYERTIHREEVRSGIDLLCRGVTIENCSIGLLFSGATRPGARFRFESGKISFGRGAYGGSSGWAVALGTTMPLEIHDSLLTADGEISSPNFGPNATISSTTLDYNGKQVVTINCNVRYQDCFFKGLVAQAPNNFFAGSTVRLSGCRLSGEDGIAFGGEFNVVAEAADCISDGPQLRAPVLRRVRYVNSIG